MEMQTPPRKRVATHSHSPPRTPSNVFMKRHDSFHIDDKWKRKVKPLPPAGDFIFNLVEADYYRDEDTSLPWRHCPDGEVAIVRLYGVTADGMSVCMHVHGVQPYFYIEAPPGYTDVHARGFLNALWDAVRDGPGASRNPFVGVELVQRASLLGYQSGLSSYLRVVTQTPSWVGRARKTIERTGMRFSTLWDGFMSFQTYESSVLFELRYLIDANINGCDWVSVPIPDVQWRSGGPTQSSRAPKSLCSIECDVHYQYVSTVKDDEICNTIAPLRVFSFDIECYAAGGNFPDATQDEVIQVSIILANNSDLAADGDHKCIARCVLTLGTCSHLPGADVYAFEAEADLLLAWRDLLAASDPDVITGYNIQGFDLPYLLTRAETLQKTHHSLNRFAYLGRIAGEKSKVRHSTFSSKALGTRDFQEVTMDGRCQVDVMVAVQREHKLRSYSLNAVSAEFLGDQKEDVAYNIIGDLHNGNAETRSRLARYCLKDAVLPLRLIARLQLIVNLVEMARVCGVPMNMLMSRGQQIKVFSCILRACASRKLVFPTHDVAAGAGSSIGYEGATVIDPIKGFHRDPVVTLDFASLYPSIMMAHNLCYTTLLPSKTAADALGLVEGTDYKAVAGGHYFVLREKEPGVLPEILRSLLEARNKAKKQLATCTDAATKAVLNGRQLAMKITANSVYGFTGAQVGKLPCLEISSAVTAYGRDMIQATKERIESRYSVQNGFSHNAKVIYGDTDSVMIKFGLPEDEMKKIFEIGMEAAADMTAQFIQPIRLEFEKVYFPYLLIAKKRYAGLLWSKPEKYNYLDSKGIESVRRDNCPLVKNVVNTVLRKLLVDRSPDDAVSYVQGVVSDLLMNRLDISNLVISKCFSKEGDKYDAKQAHVELVKRMRQRDPTTAPVVGDRVPYVIVKGSKDMKANEKAEDPIYALDHGLSIDAHHYLEHQLKMPLLRLFEAVLPNPDSTLFHGAHTLKVRVATPAATKGGMMRFAHVSLACLECKRVLSKEELNVSRALCGSCLRQGKEASQLLQHINQRNHLELLYGRVWVQCQRCSGSTVEEVLCQSRDCPVFYMRRKVQKDLDEEQAIVDRFGTIDW